MANIPYFSSPLLSYLTKHNEGHLPVHRDTFSIIFSIPHTKHSVRLGGNLVEKLCNLDNGNSKLNILFILVIRSKDSNLKNKFGLRFKYLDIGSSTKRKNNSLRTIKIPKVREESHHGISKCSLKQRIGRSNRN